jgi:hypothetical protein
MGENSTFSSQILMPENTNKDKVSNYSMAFDGINDYIDCGSIIGGGGDISVSIWIKTSASSWYDLEYPIVMYSSLGSGTAIGRTYGQGANRVIGIGSNYGTTKLNDGNWHHLVWTREISTGNMAGYVDGNATPEVTSTSVGSFIYNFRIGAYTNSIGTPTLWFDGLVDEVGYWNSVLSTSDIADIYNSGTPTDLSLLSTPPVAWYRMGEEATFVYDFPYPLLDGVWTIPDQIGSNNGTSANMDIYTRVGEAPDSENNALSYNMEAADIVEDTPPNP